MARRFDPARQYLEAWHHRHPGATSLVMAGARDEQDRTSYQLLAEAVHDRVGPVLDLACGDGQLLDLLRRRATSPFGVDASGAELAAARRRLGTGCGLVRGDALCLPFPPSSFAVVTCHFALMLLQPLEHAIAEVARVTRRAGALVAVMPASTRDDETNAWIPFRSALRELVTADSVDIPDIQDDRALEPEMLAELLGRCRLTVTSARQIQLQRRCTVEEAKTVVLLTYVPDLLQPAARAQLDARLTDAYRELADEEGLVSFSEDVTLIVARKDG